VMISKAEPPPALSEALAELDGVVGLVRRRRRCSADEAEELAAEARLRLLEEECQVLRSYSGRSSLRTYLVVVVDRLLMDIRRHRWGVWRPSAEARRSGAAAIRLDQMVYRDGVALEEAVARLAADPGVGLDEKALRDLASRLPPRTRRKDEGEAGLARLAVSPTSVEELAFSDDRRKRREEMRQCLRAALATFSDEDAVIVRLRFSEGMKISTIARSLGLEQKRLYRRIEDLVAKLRRALERGGFDGAEVAELSSHAPWDDDGVEVTP